MSTLQGSFETKQPATAVAAPKFIGAIFFVAFYAAYLMQLVPVLKKRFKPPVMEGRLFTAALVCMLSVIETTALGFMVYTAWITFVPQLVESGERSLGRSPHEVPQVYATHLLDDPSGPRNMAILAAIAALLYHVFFARKIWVSSTGPFIRVLSFVLIGLGFVQLPLAIVEFEHEWNGPRDFVRMAFVRGMAGLFGQLAISVMMYRLFAPALNSPLNNLGFYFYQLGPVLFITLLGQVSSAFETYWMYYEPYLLFTYASIPLYGNVLLSWINADNENVERVDDHAQPRVSFSSTTKQVVYVDEKDVQATPHVQALPYNSGSGPQGSN